MDSGLARVLPSYGSRNRLKGYRGIAMLNGLQDKDQAEKAIWTNWLFVAATPSGAFKVYLAARQSNSIGCGA
jgi:hypothetical protein